MKFHTSGEKNDKQFKRIGRKMGNLVAVMLGVSITVVVLVCVLMFYNHKIAARKPKRWCLSRKHLA